MTIEDYLDQAPRIVLGHWPTPLEPAPRLTAELGGPNIWIKRDDCTGLATGGNKTRKLEFLLGEAQAQGKDTVVTFGAIQSNHARQTAAACAKLGLACHLILTDQVSSQDNRYKSGGNVLLDHILGAQIHIVPAGDTDGIRALLDSLKSDHELYVIPGGGSNATGALGYALCARELLTQAQALGIEAAAIVHASSSAGTQAGLLWGLHMLHSTAAVYGINVYHDDPETLSRTIRKLLSDLDARFDTDSTDVSININHAYRGDGYGQVNKETVAAIELMASMEGLLFDPVYSGKALRGLIDQISIGAFDGMDDIILIHTGGVPALNVYQNSFEHGE